MPPRPAAAGNGVLALLAMGTAVMVPDEEEPAGPPDPVPLPAAVPPVRVVPQTPGPELPFRQVYQMFYLGAYWCYTFRTYLFSALFGNVRLDVRGSVVERWRTRDVTSWNIAGDAYVYRFDLGGAGFPNFTVNRTSNPGVVWIVNADNVMVRIMWGYGRSSARLLPNYHNQFNDWAFDWTQAGLELPVPQLPGTPIYP